MRLMSDRTCQNILNRWLKEKYGEEKVSEMGFYNDTINSRTYSFNYDVGKLQTRKLTVDRNSGYIREDVI